MKTRSLLITLKSKRSANTQQREGPVGWKQEHFGQEWNLVSGSKQYPFKGLGRCFDMYDSGNMLPLQNWAKDV